MIMATIKEYWPVVKVSGKSINPSSSRNTACQNTTTAKIEHTHARKVGGGRKETRNHLTERKERQMTHTCSRTRRAIKKERSEEQRERDRGAIRNRKQGLGKETNEGYELGVRASNINFET